MVVWGSRYILQVPTLPKTNSKFAPKNRPKRPKRKGNICLPLPSIFRWFHSLLVSGSVSFLKVKSKSRNWCSRCLLKVRHKRVPIYLTSTASMFAMKTITVTTLEQTDLHSHSLKYLEVDKQYVSLVYF